MSGQYDSTGLVASTLVLQSEGYICGHRASRICLCSLRGLFARRMFVTLPYVGLIFVDDLLCVEIYIPDTHMHAHMFWGWGD